MEMSHAMFPRSLFVLVILGLSPFANPCLAESAGGLESLSQRHREELSKTRQESASFIADLNANYLVSLEHYDSDRYKAGDLEAMIAIREERVRMKREGTVRSTDVVKEPVGLAALQQRYIRSLANHAGDIARREAPVHRQYLAVLEPLKQELARAERFEEAILVRDEIARIRQLVPQASPGVEQVYLPGELRKGLVLDLPFPRKPGFDARTGATIFDRSGRRNHAALEGGAKWTANGHHGGGIELAGGENRVAVPLAAGEQGTLGVWIRSSSDLGAGAPPVGIASNLAGVRFFAKSGETGKIEFSIAPDGGDPSVCSTRIADWGAGTWYFLCCSWDGEHQRVYVDGNLEGEQPQTQALQGAELLIGSAEFSGTVDSVMMWQRALSESEVAALFRATGG